MRVSGKRNRKSRPFWQLAVTMCLLSVWFQATPSSAQAGVRGVRRAKLSSVSDAVEPEASGEIQPAPFETSREPVEELPAPVQEPMAAGADAATPGEAMSESRNSAAKLAPETVADGETGDSLEIDPIRDPKFTATPKLRPYLGARVVKNGLGSVTVIRVKNGTPAKEGGLIAGDAITHVDGNDVDSFAALMRVLLKKEPGDSVQLKLQRSGKSISVAIELDGR